ncbi:branched-chain amino acid ABC transporter permease [Bradyrhizobium barranii subsp. apii]|uniref:Branched-chain amino acid ABC transporter permease n=1 Tax=Bradyrhizobium barranii subsp. apii TaxID=2819348 RepID=A0A8T5V6K7_9BRAD|nr:branched-chain amino acid ABC transporter permease [Bradyrhizobium barranii]UPT91970.1 branched-chain amino acid ABC transporter permease [Bradyrhizobium barranii subsp. apii]
MLSAFLFELISYASIVVLVVVGLVIVVNMTGIFNLAHGELILLGAFVQWSVAQAGLSPWIGLLLAPLIVGGLGAFLEITVIRRFYRAPVAAMLATYAIGQIIRELIRWYIGGNYHTVPEPLLGSLAVGGLQLPYWRLVIIAAAASTVIAAILVLTRTRIGLRARAAFENPRLARASGMSTQRIFTATFAVGAALAGFAGALIVPVYSLAADIGLRLMIQSFLAVLLGGADLISGPLAGAAIIGFLNAGLPWIVSPTFSEILLVFFAIALIRLQPQGVFSKER